MRSRRSLLLTGGASVLAADEGNILIRCAHLNAPGAVARTPPQLQALPGLGDRRPDMVLCFGYAWPMLHAPRHPVAGPIDV